MKQKLFLSCDWGTSRFRLRLADAEQERILAEVISEEGIAATYRAWKETNKAATDRLSFYCSVIQKHIVQLERKSDLVLEKDTAVIVSGMASSTLGMKELPYKEAPFLSSGDDLLIDPIMATKDFSYPLYLVSGVKTTNDVMRGEEVQIVGCASPQGDSEQIIILPGTHSKHAVLSHKKIVSFTTFMTGDFFRLLSQSTVLSQSVEAGAYDSICNQEAFAKGVADSLAMNLLQSSFGVRTNDLFHRMTKRENYFYLSGLLIGNELQNLKRSAKLILVANPALSILYEKALEVLGFNHWKVLDADECLLKGQIKCYWRIIA